MTAEDIGDVTALITAAGLLIVAGGVALGKIAGCLADLRKQLLRLAATNDMHDRDSARDLSHIRDEIAGVRRLLLSTSDRRDVQIADLRTRVKRIETQQKETCTT